jgi:CRP-like cAMP-binding protein
MPSQPNHNATPWAEGPLYQEGLNDLPDVVVQALNAVGKTRAWQRGDYIQRQGQKQGDIMVSIKGRLAVMVTGPAGNDTLLRFVTQGEIVGLPTVLAKLPASTHIVANSDCETLHITRQNFVNVLMSYPEGAIGVAVILSHRLAELFRFVEMTAHRPLHERVNYALRRLARRNGESDGKGTTLLKVTQAELATAAGASRQRVHLELKRLESLGLIALGYGSVTIKTDQL